MNTTVYTTSFTKGALLVRESCLVAEIYMQTKDWDATRHQIVDNNLLQARTVSTGKKMWSEISSRLKALSDDLLTILVNGNDVDQRLVLWIAVCRRYTFIGDFAKEVLVEKYRAFSATLSLVDFDTFFHDKAEWHPELERLSESTSKKIRQVVFKMMKEANVLGAQKEIQPVVLLETLNDKLAFEDKVFFPVPGA